MAGTKATVKMMQVPTFGHSPGRRIENKNIMSGRLRNAHYKIKKLLPEYKQVDVQKNGQIMRSMNVIKKKLFTFLKKEK